LRPLQDRRILVTRRREQAGALVDALSALGATVVEVPLVAREPPEDLRALDEALGRLAGYQWLAFTSANAVEAVAERLADLGAAIPDTVRLASVGPATAQAVAETLAGRRVDLQPASQLRAEGLVEAFRAVDLAGARVLVPLSDRARDTLATGLRGQGATVDAVVAYRTVRPEGVREPLERALADGIDLVVLASPSAVEALSSALGERARSLPVAVIGPVTEQAARQSGLDVRAVATTATAPGLAAAAERLLARTPPRPPPPRPT
jgi:uroporphyrinogen-III synthase